MVRNLNVAAAAVLIVIFAIQAGSAFPRVLRQEQQSSPSQAGSSNGNSQTEGISDNNIDYYEDPDELVQQSQSQQSTSNSKIAELTTEITPEEVKEDIQKIAAIVEERKEQLGHNLSKNELKEVEKEMEQLPWYQKFGKWLEGAYHSTKSAIKGIFTKGNREERGYPDIYSFYSN